MLASIFQAQLQKERQKKEEMRKELYDLTYNIYYTRKMIQVMEKRMRRMHLKTPMLSYCLELVVGI